MAPEFSAKSYYPSSIFNLKPDKDAIRDVGSRAYHKKSKGNEELAKLIFMRVTDQSLSALERRLSAKESLLPKNFVMDVRKISNIDILTPTEQILGVANDWKDGRIEVVLHPFGIDNARLIKQFSHLLKENGVDISDLNVRQYETGITFASLWGNRKLLKALEGYNPLRTLHTLQFRNLPIVRGSSVNGGPTPPSFVGKSKIVVGMFDGGVDTSNPYLKGYVDNTDGVRGVPLAEFVDHGTKVAGAILYGPLNQYPNASQLPRPDVYVKSFRVLADDSHSDPDLYAAIDAIESIVPQNKSIKVYNLSVGPDGPILDDAISRFTYSCDTLAAKHGVLFCNAVGNSGELGEEYGRIQAPSDMVNGLGVGAYTQRKGKVLRAPYSCFGPGREGNKLKPDIVAFGGCDQTPVHLIGSTAGEKILSGGTSFASPVVAQYGAMLIGKSNGAIDALTARAMLLHSAIKHEAGQHSIEMGHGLLPESIDEIVSCEDKTYTLLYQGELLSGKYAEFKIPWINEIQEGKATIRWTVAVLTEVDAHSPDDYTSSSVVTAFYPNSHKYNFKNDEGKVMGVDTSIQLAMIKALRATGWKQDNFPISESGPTPYATEGELRSDLKWDSVDNRVLRKFSRGVKDPIFHIHALRRGTRNIVKKVKYALVLTVETPKASIDLYSRVVNAFPALVPIKLTLPVEVQVQTSASMRQKK